MAKTKKTRNPLVCEITEEEKEGFDQEDYRQVMTEKNITISDVKFVQACIVDTCPVCGRKKSLGRVNLNYPGAEELRCIDCHFSPVPIEHWINCKKCGEFFPGGCCDCGCEN